MSKPRILIIDDDTKLLKTLSGILGVHGYEPHASENGAGGLAWLNENSADVVLLDLVLPDIPGIELLKKIRADHPATEIIILTGKASMDSAIEATNRGAFSYLVKPYDIEQLLLYIGRAIEKQLVGNSLRKSEDFFRRLFEESPLGLAIIDHKGRFVRVNAMLCQMLGFSEGQLVASNLSSVFQFAGSDEYVENIRRLVNGDIRYWKSERCCSKESGEPFWANMTVSLIPDETADTSFFLNVFEDVTERKNLEIQLQHSQRMEAVGTLAGGIAHDFNNILTGIIGYANLLEMQLTSEDEALSIVKGIMEGADRASNLIHSLLSFSRKQQIMLKPADLNEIVGRMEKMLRRLIREDIEFRTSLTDQKLVVMADAAQIEQVLMNFAANARDAIKGQGRITIDTRLTELGQGFRKRYGFGEPGHYALLTFSDTGFGMDEKTRQRIFEPFFTTKDPGMGTGLGLAVAYGIVKQHKGYILCHSEPGKGTTFRLYLPITYDVVEKSVNKPAALPKGTETILVAEDDPTTRNLSKLMLENFGYNVIEAVDGKDAVSRFMARKDDIRLVLLDVIMPKMNGREALKRIEQIKPGIKSIFVSGYTADILQRDELLKERKIFLSKPILYKELLTTVRNLLDSGNLTC